MDPPPPYDPSTVARRLTRYGYGTHALTIFESYTRKCEELAFSLLNVARRLDKFATRVEHLCRGPDTNLAKRRFNSFGHVHSVEPAFVNQFILSIQFTKSSLPNPELFTSILIQWFDLYNNWCSSLASSNTEQTRLTRSILEDNYYFDLIVNSLQYIEEFKPVIREIRNHSMSFNQACRFLRVFDSSFLAATTKVRNKFFELLSANNIDALDPSKTRLMDKHDRLLKHAGEIKEMIQKAAALKLHRPPLSL